MIYLTPLLRFNSACFHFKVVVNGVVLDCILFDILLVHASAKTNTKRQRQPSVVCYPVQHFYNDNNNKRIIEFMFPMMLKVWMYDKSCFIVVQLVRNWADRTQTHSIWCKKVFDLRLEKCVLCSENWHMAEAGCRWVEWWERQGEEATVCSWDLRRPAGCWRLRKCTTNGCWLVAGEKVVDLQHSEMKSY